MGFLATRLDISCIEGESGDGIWIPHATDVDDNIDAESEEDESEPSVHSQETSESEDHQEARKKGRSECQQLGLGDWGRSFLTMIVETAEYEMEIIRKIVTDQARSPVPNSVCNHRQCIRIYFFCKSSH